MAAPFGAGQPGAYCALFSGTFRAGASAVETVVGESVERQDVAGHRLVENLVDRFRAHQLLHDTPFIG